MKSSESREVLDFKKLQNRFKMETLIMTLVMYYVADEGRCEIPTEGKFILIEMAATLYERLNGFECVQFISHRMGADAFDAHPHEWERGINRMIGEMFGMHAEKIREDVREALCGLLMMNHYTEGPDGGYTNGIEDFMRNFPYPSGHSRFTMHKEWLRDTYERVIVSADPYVRELCEDIARRMAKYMERDIAYIKKRYSW